MFDHSEEDKDLDSQVGGNKAQRSDVLPEKLSTEPEYKGVADNAPAPSTSNESVQETPKSTSEPEKK